MCSTDELFEFKTHFAFGILTLPTIDVEDKQYCEYGS